MPSEKERESVGGVQDALQDSERRRLGVLESLGAGEALMSLYGL